MLELHWIKYEGKFMRDAKHGLGTLYLSNGDKFFGNFVNDKVHGMGTYYCRETAEIVTGQWDNNRLVDVF